MHPRRSHVLACIVPTQRVVAVAGVVSGLVLGAVLGLWVSPAQATQADSQKLPPTAAGCRLCHSGPSATVDFVPPGGSEEFTQFGLDWLSLGAQPGQRAWKDMAALNSDTDGCSNGYEMGDPDGNFPLGTVELRTLDPNAADCVLPLDEQSWGNLKSLFES